MSSSSSSYQETVRIIDTTYRIVPLFSLIGSICILQCIRMKYKAQHATATGRSRSGTKIVRPTYLRLLITICMVDIIWSINFILGRLMVPNNEQVQVRDGYNFTFNGHGNHLSCGIQGMFLFVGGTTTPYLNSCLMIYFVLSIRYNISQQTISRKYETWFYVGFCLLLLIAISGMFLGMYHAEAFWVEKLLPNQDSTNPLYLQWFNGTISNEDIGWDFPFCFVEEYPKFCSTTPIPNHHTNNDIDCVGYSGYADLFTVIGTTYGSVGNFPQSKQLFMS